MCWYSTTLQRFNIKSKTLKHPKILNQRTSRKKSCLIRLISQQSPEQIRNKHNSLNP